MTRSSSPESRSKQISLQLFPHEHEALWKVAVKTRRTLSSLIREGIEKVLEEHNEPI